MASKTDEIIRLRNEGMAYALKIAKESGLDALQEQVKLRGLLKVSVKFTPEELTESINNIAQRVYNNMLTIAYAVLHDEFKYGEVRLKRFKALFDKKTYLVGEEDPLGRHYARFEDYAEEANRLYQLGIDMEKIRETQQNNDDSSRKYVPVDEIAKFLIKNGFSDAADALVKTTEEPKRKHLSKKERQKAESRMDSDRHNKYYMDDAEQENVEYWFNIFGLALAEQCNFPAEKIAYIWQAVDKINGAIADGVESLDSTKDKLIDAAGIQCEFTKY